MIHKCTSVRHSLKAQEIGCDAVSVDGFECGRASPARTTFPNMILLPRAADELDIPFVASGGQGRCSLPGRVPGHGRGGHEHGHPLHVLPPRPRSTTTSRQAIVAAIVSSTPAWSCAALRNTERVSDQPGVSSVFCLWRRTTPGGSAQVRGHRGRGRRASIPRS